MPVAGVTLDGVKSLHRRLVPVTGDVEAEKNSLGSAFSPSTFEKIDANELEVSTFKNYY